MISIHVCGEEFDCSGWLCICWKALSYSTSHVYCFRSKQYRGADVEDSNLIEVESVERNKPGLFVLRGHSI